MAPRCAQAAADAPVLIDDACAAAEAAGGLKPDLLLGERLVGFALALGSFDLIQWEDDLALV